MQNKRSAQFIRTIFIIALAVISFLILIAVTASEETVSTPNRDGSYVEITHWTLTDANGVSREITLPYTLSYKGDNDDYTLTASIPPTPVLPDSESSTFRIYPNYMDVEIYLDGVQWKCTHVSDDYAFGVTGNVFHFIDLPPCEEEREIMIKVHCQLGDSTSYYIRPALLGSKTAMYVDDFVDCMPTLLLVVFLLIVAISALVLKRLVSADFGSSSFVLFFSAFVMLFSFYTFLETEIALLLIGSSRFVYMAKFMFLALFIIPLFELISLQVNPKYRRISEIAVYLSCINFVGQTVLHFTDTVDYCSMMYVTHGITFVGVVILITCLFLSGQDSINNLLVLIPMAAGFVADILLIYVGHPSYHNNFWFTLGMSVYILIELIRIFRTYLSKFHLMVESDTLKSMAYSDMLTGVGNRNAYEQRLKTENADTPAHDLGCIVVDVTALKQINDTRGHSAGDTALIETAEAIRKYLPKDGSCFRTGGDEFIVLIDHISEEALAQLVSDIEANVSQRADTRELPLLLSIGSGLYQTADETVLDFVRRIDSQMYAHKRIQKQKLRDLGYQVRD